jgi:hypothetical protein
MMGALTHCYLVRMDVQRDREALFNEIYDTEHVPELGKVPGVQRVSRYRTPVPHEPRYLALYEIARPDLPVSSEWKTASDTGRWAPEVRPYTMNRENHRAVCTRIGGSASLTYATRHLFLEMTDVEARKAAAFHEVYERDRLPAFAEVSGIRAIVRFEAKGPGHPGYVTMYEIEDPGVLTSEAFVRADRTERWRTEVLPWTYNRHLVVYDRIGRTAVTAP